LQINRLFLKNGSYQAKLYSKFQFMKKHFILKVLLLSVILLFHFENSYSQQLPADMSQIKASQIPQAQLIQIQAQARMNNLSDNELMQEFQKRGMPEAEIKSLLERINALPQMNQGDDMEYNPKSNNLKRAYKGTSDFFKMPEVKSRVFGADLFGNAASTNAVNLKIATPQNYILGPEDEIQIDVYGINVSTQQATVSPEGKVNVKYIGPVNVSGLTIEQATSIIKSRLTKIYPSLSTGETKLTLTLGSIRSIQVNVVGAVKNPGVVTLPSLATIFNALYISGGPVDNGSFRNIELIRNNKIVSVLDLYDFILKGDQSKNLILRDNDVVRVPFVTTQIALAGSVHKEGIFELKPKETVSDVLAFAGGFNGMALRNVITGTRTSEKEKRIIDIANDNFNTFILQSGDSLFVDSVISKFENRVHVAGNVYKPGSYALEPQMDVDRLIEKAQGLKEGSFINRFNLVRRKTDQTKEYRVINYKELMKQNKKFYLQKDDSVYIASILELRDSSILTINGPVKKPGAFRYEDSMTLGSLIILAGGFLENATPKRIEIGRRKDNITLKNKNESTTEIITVDLDKDLGTLNMDLTLMPYDIINIKVDPFKVKQTNVKISGEIMYAGSYTLVNPEERLSSLIQRSGGLTPFADPAGVKLVRKKEKTDTAQLKRLALASLNVSKIGSNEKSDTSNLLKQADVEETTTEVAIDFEYLQANPNSDQDVTLKDGDEIIVPRFVNTVNISGEVLKPVTVQFKPGQGVSRYLYEAGGFTKSALKSRVYVVYVNGKSAKTKKLLGVKFYPKIRPGSSIFVPVKALNREVDPSKFGVLLSAFSSIMTTLVIIFKN